MTAHPRCWQAPLSRNKNWTFFFMLPARYYYQEHLEPSFHLLICCFIHMMKGTPSSQLKPPYSEYFLASLNQRIVQTEMVVQACTFVPSFNAAHHLMHSPKVRICHRRDGSENKYASSAQRPSASTVMWSRDTVTWQGVSLAGGWGVPHDNDTYMTPWGRPDFFALGLKSDVPVSLMIQARDITKWLKIFHGFLQAPLAQTWTASSSVSFAKSLKLQRKTFRTSWSLWSLTFLQRYSSQATCRCGSKCDFIDSF